MDGAGTGWSVGGGHPIFDGAAEDLIVANAICLAVADIL
jgi:hypothetical protein